MRSQQIMFTNGELHGFLTSKMLFTREDTGHRKYKISDDLGVCIPLSLPIHLQHHRGDVSPHIIQQIRHLFGISENQLKGGAACHYSMLSIYIKMILTQLTTHLEHARSDPVVYDPMLLAFADSIPYFLEILISKHSRRRIH